MAPTRASMLGSTECGTGGITCTVWAQWKGSLAHVGSPGSPCWIMVPVMMSEPAGTMKPNHAVQMPLLLVLPRFGNPARLLVAIASLIKERSKPERPRPA